jgi:glycosyltransferase involved in cell wall biosynthesis
MLLSASTMMSAAGLVQAAVSLRSADESTIAESFVSSGFEVVHLGGPGISRARTLAGLRRTLHDWRPDCVHIHAEALSPATSALAVSRRVGVVRSVHNSFPFTGPLRARKLAERTSQRTLGVRFVAVSPTVQENELKRFRNPTTLINNWFDDTRFQRAPTQRRIDARQGLGIGARPCVAVVGNCSAVKNHQLLFHALAALPASRRPILLHVGHEPDETERALTDHLGLASDVQYLGHRDPLDILQAADAFAMPSLYEGVGIAALEAAAVGLPLILADAPGLRDLAALGDGVQLRPLTPSSFAESLAEVRLIDDNQEVASRLATAACETYGMEQGASAYLELYRKPSSR